MAAVTKSCAVIIHLVYVRGQVNSLVDRVNHLIRFAENYFNIRNRSCHEHAIISNASLVRVYWANTIITCCDPCDPYLP